MCVFVFVCLCVHVCVCVCLCVCVCVCVFVCMLWYVMCYVQCVVVCVTCVMVRTCVIHINHTCLTLEEVVWCLVFFRLIHDVNNKVFIENELTIRHASLQISQ